ncbi:MAG: flagellar hook-length control protein FliK [Dissulfurispiraceae bacterium]|jgi:hypothetical protein|nr:flagellar hook-length control protein FliK [Dissulfurispiraceae bacterium]
MIYFKVGPTPVDSYLTLAKSSGKELSFKVGDIVKAEIMNLLPDAAVLRMKGEVITAKTDVPLTQEGAAYFKVVASEKGNEFRLQFLGYADQAADGKAAGQIQPFKPDTVSHLMHELAQLLSKPGSAGIQSQILQDILKSLPSDMSQIPKDIKTQLQSLLQDGLRVTGQTIQSRVEALLEQLPQQITQNAKTDILVSIDKLVNSQLRAAIQDTGVAFEAKMKSLVDLAKLMEYASQEGARTKASGPAEMQRQPVSSEGLKILLQGDAHAVKGDLKATLLQLKQVIAEKLDLPLTKEPLTAQQIQTLRNAGVQIESLIKDVETFQLLSKITDSFYTFLPVSWSELRDAEVVFKRGRPDAKGLSYSCTLNLDLDSFGRLSIMLMMYNREFFVSFRTVNTEFMDTLKNSSDDLKDLFKEKGLVLKGINFLDDEASSENVSDIEDIFLKNISIKA